MSPSLSLETPGMKDPQALHRSRSPSPSRAVSRSADWSFAAPPLANQLAPNLLRALPGRVLRPPGRLPVGGLVGWLTPFDIG